LTGAEVFFGMAAKIQRRRVISDVHGALKGIGRGNEEVPPQMDVQAKKQASLMKCRQELHRPDRIHQGRATMAMTGERAGMEEEGRTQGVEKTRFEVE
jgi:hypothetical protein